ncbi:hypothetical protein SK128_013591 [Halocaridina rubra]|uniref:Carbohydrate sulfotransferase n=1 Tax=Halocaridina rubra TaxID=373956 RepID=A0AAN8WMJ9_HALRR
MPNGQDVSDIIDSEELDKESFQGKKKQPGATLRVHLPEREVVAHPEQYQKDVAKLIRNEWTEEMIKRQEDLFRKRSAHVEEVCNSLTLNGALAAKMGSVFENMRWISKHNMIWCPIFKAASTTWVKNLLMIAGESKIHARSLHARARQLFGPPNDPRVRDKLLRESQRMMIVRHPLERLLSAYRDKMLRVRHAHDPFVRIQKAIMLKYPDPDAPPPPAVTAIPDPKNMTDKLPTTHPTFKQFLMKARDDLRTVWNNKGKTIVNMHWRPFWLTCAPCHVIYDYIGKVETLDWDQEYIIRKMGLQDLLYNAHTHSSNFDSYNTTSEAARDYFKQVPLSLLKDVVELYKPDFLLFDYSPDSYYKLAKPDA